MIDKECLSCGFVTEIEQETVENKCPKCDKYYHKVISKLHQKKPPSQYSNSSDSQATNATLLSEFLGEGSFKDKTYLVINSLLALVVLLFGLYFILDIPLSSLGLIVISLIISPQIRNFVYSKTKLYVPLKFKAIGITFFIVIFTFNFDLLQIEKRAEERAEEALQTALKIIEFKREEEKRNLEYFKSNSVEVLNKIRIKIDKKHYKEAVEIGSKYLKSENKQLHALFKKANSKQILKLISQVKSSDFEGYKKLYQKLYKLNPNVSRYRENQIHYQNLIDKQKSAKESEIRRKSDERNTRVLNFGKRPVANYNGQYHVITEYLTRNAHDPDSIDIISCSVVSFTKDGWRIGCDYRGRNAFGALRINNKWFIVNQERVIKVINKNRSNG